MGLWVSLFMGRLIRLIEWFENLMTRISQRQVDGKIKCMAR